MPLLIPTVEEFQSLPWPKQKAAHVKIRELLLEIDPKGYNKRIKNHAVEADWAAWGKAVRDEARTLMDDWNMSNEEVQGNRTELLNSLKH